jgi:hypothetical protein
VAGDLAARAYAEARTQKEVNRQAGPDLDVRVHIRSFPFIPRLLVAGQVQQVTATASAVKEGPITIQNLQLDLHDVRIDRRQTLNDRRLFLKSIGHGSMSGEVTSEALSQALGFPVQVVDGGIEATVAGHTFRAEVSMKNGVLTLGAAGITLPSLTVPIGGLLPCRPSATQDGDLVKVSCAFTAIPSQLIQLINGATAHG